MKKNTNKSEETLFNKLLPYFINSLIIAIILCLIFFISQSNPFGNKYILGKGDAIFQFKPMLYNFISRLKTNTLYMYTFNNGLGNSFLFNFTYYLMSPLNLIALLFKNPNTMFFSVILLKTICTALTSTFYAKKKGCSNLVSLIVSLSYVFSSWFLIYYYNITWLDTFLIFPLIQYGLEELITKHKYLLFILSLSYSFLTNIYLSFSILVYIIIYFIIRNFFYEKNNFKEKIKTTIYFILSNFISLLLITFYLNVLLTIKKQVGLELIDLEKETFTLGSLSFIKNLFYGTSQLDYTNSIVPNIATNTLILLSTIFYFLNSKINTRDKLFTLIGLVLIVECLFIPNLDSIMHIFNDEVSFIYSYTFIFIFLSIMLFIKNIQNYDKKDLKKLIPAIIILSLIIILLHKSISLKIIIFTLVSLLIILLLIIFYKENKIYKGLILTFVICQSFLIGYYTIPNKDKYEENTTKSFIKEPLSYRLNMIDENDYFNKNLYSNQDVIYLFSSKTYNDVLYMLPLLGVSTGTNAISSNDNNALFSLLFNVKKDYYLEKIFAVNADVKNTILSDTDVKLNYDNLIKDMTGIEELFIKKEIEPQKVNNQYNYETDIPFFFIQTSSGTIPLSYDFYINEKDTDNIVATIYIPKEEKIKEIYNALKDKQIKYTSYRDDYIEGSIDVSDNEIIFTSIPYDESWQIYIDGNKVEPLKLLDSLIGIEVDKGHHEIKMEYKNNFNKSILISIISFILLISFSIVKKIKYML